MTVEEEDTAVQKGLCRLNEMIRAVAGPGEDY